VSPKDQTDPIVTDAKHTATSIQQVGRATEVWVCRAPLSVAERRKLFEGQGGQCTKLQCAFNAIADPVKRAKGILLPYPMLSHPPLRTARKPKLFMTKSHCPIRKGRILVLPILKAHCRSAYSQGEGVMIRPHVVDCSQATVVLGGLPVINNRTHNTNTTVSQIYEKLSTRSTGRNPLGCLVPPSQTRRTEHGRADPGYRPER
jgi:hypothetical protein